MDVHDFTNPGKVHFESLVQFLEYIRSNKNLGLKYYPKIEDAHIFDLLIQTGINYDNQLMVFSD